MIELRIPYPISANRYWRTRVAGQHAMTYVSAEAKAFKQEVGWIARAAGVKLISGPVALAITLHPKTVKSGEASKVRLDLSNTIKVLEDALIEIAYYDDKQVVDLSAKLGNPIPGGGVTVKISESTMDGALPF